VTGDGIEEFFKAVDASRGEYERYADKRHFRNTISFAAGNTFQNSSGHGLLEINLCKI
jgi:hypothetical protein